MTGRQETICNIYDVHLQVDLWCSYFLMYINKLGKKQSNGAIKILYDQCVMCYEMRESISQKLRGFSLVFYC